MPNIGDKGFAIINKAVVPFRIDDIDDENGTYRMDKDDGATLYAEQDAFGTDFFKMSTRLCVQQSAVVCREFGDGQVVFYEVPNALGEEGRVEMLSLRSRFNPELSYALCYVDNLEDILHLLKEDPDMWDKLRKTNHLVQV